MPKFRFYIIVSLIFFASVAGVANASGISELANSDEWLKLMHYHQVSGGYKGLINSDNFYVSSEGRYNPQAELAAEIEEFNTDKQTKCDFPARFMWLKSQGLVDGNLKTCQDYQSFIDDIKPNGITVLFTNAYMSNPASLFGHTLIRIDTSRKGTQMLAHGSNFGAKSGTDTGTIFALKGLMGGYDGAYNISPYWDIINTYNNIENRDIWEYHLNLTPEEQEKFVNHLYEMRNATVRYFFLSKNCSYMILELLEAVRPELDLSSQYQYWAIPLDTLKTIKSIPGLIDDVKYRPARYTKIKSSLQSMNDAQYQAFLAAIKQHDYDMNNLTEVDKSEVLETAYQYYQYRYTAQDMELQDYRQNSFAVLRKRSQMPAAEQKEISGKDPSLSHGSMQVELNGGVYNKHSFEEFVIRPAYTSLLDNDYGLLKGAGIKVLESRWRYYNQLHKAVLQKLTFLGIDSLVPADRVFSPYSYKTNFAIKREYNPQNEKEGCVADVGFAVGKTYALTDWFWVYAMLGANGQYGGFIHGNQWVGIKPEIGIFNDFGKVHLHNFIEQTTATRHEGSGWKYHSTAGLSITPDYLLKAEYILNHSRSSRKWEEFSIGIQYAF